MTDKTVQDSPVMDATQEAILNVLRGAPIVHDVPILYHARVIEGLAGYLRQALPSAALVASAANLLYREAQGLTQSHTRDKEHKDWSGEEETKAYVEGLIELAKGLEALVCAPAGVLSNTAPNEPFGIILNRFTDDAGTIDLAIWNGTNYELSDGDCFQKEPDGTLDGYTVEWLTHHQLEKRLEQGQRAISDEFAEQALCEYEKASVNLSLGQRISVPVIAEDLLIAMIRVDYERTLGVLRDSKFKSDGNG